MIKNIIFDIGNVLAHFRWKDYIGERFSPKIQNRMEYATVHGPYWDEVDRGAIPIAEVVKLCAALEPELAKEIAAFFANREELVEEYPYAADLVRGLKRNGYKVYLLSNYAGDVFEYAKQHFTFIPLVDGGVISYEIHKVKPEPEIYETLLEKYQLNPDECVFLDDLERNLIGARKHGIHTVLFENLAQALSELEKLGVRTKGVV